MKKKELLEIIKDVDDDKEIWIVSKDYEPDNDMYWSPDYQTEIHKVEVDECNEIYIYTEIKEFM